MSRKPLSDKTKRLVLKEKQNNPSLGIRAIAKKIQAEHNIKISKSAVHKILVENGLRDRPGRKRAILSYSKNPVYECGLLLLRAIDDYLGLFDYLSKQFKIFMPRLSEKNIKKLIAFTAFSAYIKPDNFKGFLEDRNFLRLAGLYHLSSSKFNYFSERINNYKPKISLKGLKDELKLASSINLQFDNGYSVYCDGRLSTLWDAPCEIPHFYLPLRPSFLRITRMLKKNILAISYTKSFGKISPLVLNLFTAIESGLKKVIFLDPAGSKIKEIGYPSLIVRPVIGYYPDILKEGISFMDNSKKFKKMAWRELGEGSYLDILSKSSQPIKDKEFKFLNVLLDYNSYSWGLMTIIKKEKNRINKLLKKYLYFFPYVQKTFPQDMQVIEKSLLVKEGSAENPLNSILPDKLLFSSPRDFMWLAQMLSAVFKEIIGGWEPRGKKGDFSVGKEYILIDIEEIPKKIKDIFNKGAFFIGEKRAFINPLTG